MKVFDFLYYLLVRRLVALRIGLLVCLLMFSTLMVRWWRKSSFLASSSKSKTRMNLTTAILRRKKRQVCFVLLRDKCKNKNSRLFE